jgi:hypothetical protein
MKTQMNINERFLHQIWKKKLFNVSTIQTLDGQPIKIQRSGILNKDSGPDFKSAKLVIGEVLYEGDIEIHRTVSDWLLHSHSNNPKYNNLILHVVLYNQASFIPTFTHSGRKVPVLILENYLTKPLRDIWEEAISKDREERTKTIACFEKNETIPLESKYIWIERLGFRRMETHVKKHLDRLEKIVKLDNDTGIKYQEIIRFQKHQKLKNERIRQRRFWDQLFYEQLSEALGFSKNKEPFLKLTKILPISYINEHVNIYDSNAILKIQALLFGVSGLLPEIDSSFDETTIEYVTNLNTLWNEFKNDFGKKKMNRSDWQFFRLRPHNFPTLRIAGLSYLLPSFLSGKIVKDTINEFRNKDQKIEDTIKALQDKFIVVAEDYWVNYYDFNYKGDKINKTLIGQSRADDIIINAVISMVILFARIFNEKYIEKFALSFYHQYPRLSDNEYTKYIVKELLNNNPILTAKQAQGALQLYRFFCSSNKCEKCDINKALNKEDVSIQSQEKQETQTGL